MNNQRARGWMFKIYNPTEEDLPTLNWKNSSYIVYQKEKDSDGKHLYHGYVLFNQAIRMAAVEKLNSHAQWSPREGTHDQAQKACTNMDVRIGGPIELHGKKKQSSLLSSGRYINDCFVPRIEYFRANVIALQIARTLEIPLDDIVQKYPWMCDRVERYQEERVKNVPPMTYKPIVHWLWGSTGSGKSHKAWTLTTYKGSTDFKWVNDSGVQETWYRHDYTNTPYVHSYNSNFNGYFGQADVIFDDLTADLMKYHELLKLFSDKPMKVSSYGHSVNWRPNRIFVTAMEPPELVFRNEPDLNQILKRIDVVEQCRYSDSVLGKRSFDENPLDVFKRPKQIEIIPTGSLKFVVKDDTEQK